jgi:hypothetical protein
MTFNRYICPQDSPGEKKGKPASGREASVKHSEDTYNPVLPFAGFVKKGSCLSTGQPG